MWLVHHRIEGPNSGLNPTGSSYWHRGKGAAHQSVCWDKISFISKNTTDMVATVEDGTKKYYREPTFEEASKFWKIPPSTLTNWWTSRDKIMGGPIPQPDILSCHSPSAGDQLLQLSHRGGRVNPSRHQRNIPRPHTRAASHRPRQRRSHRVSRESTAQPPHRDAGLVAGPASFCANLPAHQSLSPENDETIKTSKMATATATRRVTKTGTMKWKQRSTLSRLKHLWTRKRPNTAN